MTENARLFSFQTVLHLLINFGFHCKRLTLMSRPMASRKEKEIQFRPKITTC